MTALADFLLARFADDEAAVNDRTRHLAPGGWSYEEQFGDFGDDERWMIEIPAARVLAECEAKRRIVEDYQRTQTSEFVSEVGYQVAGGAVHAYRAVLRHLAEPYADHPDYREEWRS